MAKHEAISMHKQCLSTSQIFLAQNEFLLPDMFNQPPTETTYVSSIHYL